MAYGSHNRQANRAQLRELASLLGSESWIETVSVFPANRPESIVLVVASHHYPNAFVSEVYIEIQSYTNGDFHICYIEDQGGTRWMSRWGRHESDDYTRDHFHVPPEARHEDGENREFPATFIDVVGDVVAPWVYSRIGDLWDEFD